MSFVSERVRRIKLSPSVAARAIIAQLREEGRRVIDLTIGEPDFLTPEFIREAAKAAMDRGETKYPPAQGTAPLRRAIRARMLEDTGQDYPVNQIIVSTGAKQVIFNALAATLNDGDEVIIPAPFWVSYPDMVIVNGGKPVIVAATPETDYKLTPEALEAAITPATKWVLMNSPSNPTGAIYSCDDWARLTAVLARHPHVWLMTDDIYARLNFTDTPTVHPLQVEPALASRTLAINGVSKAYAMTGWRIGYGAGPDELIKAMAIVQSQSTSGASSVGQAAALAALTGDQSCVQIFADRFRERRNAAVAALQKVPELKVVVPEGAFYVFPDCSALLGKKTPGGDVIATDTDFTNYLLREAGVAVIDGHAYGAPGTFRLSFAAALEDIAAGCESIRAACAKLV
ncbi:aminotransferase class I/II-fold pyridoxal phosphate-dependent enzyme [Schauerella aestuarii]|uniref:aminotransferase class I/II-fold pyridoxal phosphate-dependent enzyme n=1 Tax=Schauerella aestuarii TaxID=2511204 RepID=UPI00136882ED|nr:aminotransferase class I/II-fold pyridoxal phosphate-dependent enzyme [Achromobacter aestuarii]MYZ45699.1 aminotransferase class I/II-fold pyridoxal phosphate-dependent enzyme [Achromobacter aestuarii]